MPKKKNRLHKIGMLGVSGCEDMLSQPKEMKPYKEDIQKPQKSK
jgi:hypothetical protein